MENLEKYRDFPHTPLTGHDRFYSKTFSSTSPSDSPPLNVTQTCNYIYKYRERELREEEIGEEDVLLTNASIKEGAFRHSLVCCSLPQKA